MPCVDPRTLKKREKKRRQRKTRRERRAYVPISIDQLPEEVLLLIFTYFIENNAFSFRAPAQVCTTWRRLMHDDSLRFYRGLRKSVEYGAPLWRYKCFTSPPDALEEAYVKAWIRKCSYFCDGKRRYRPSFGCPVVRALLWENHCNIARNLCIPQLTTPYGPAFRRAPITPITRITDRSFTVLHNTHRASGES